MKPACWKTKNRGKVRQIECGMRFDPFMAGHWLAFFAAMDGEGTGVDKALPIHEADPCPPEAILPALSGITMIWLPGAPLSCSAIARTDELKRVA